MAAKKSTSAKKKTTGKTRTTKAPAPKKSSLSDPVVSEIRSISILILLVILNLCMILHNRMGIIGRTIYKGGIGLFGFSAYLLCLFALIVVILHMAHKLEGHAAKAWAVLGVILGLSVLLYLINGDLSVKELKAYYENATAANGGLLGGLVAGFLVRLIGRIGAMVVVLLILLITIVIVTERSLTRDIGHVAQASAQEVRTMHEAHVRTREERRAALEEKRHEEEIAKARVSRELREMDPVEESVPEEEPTGPVVRGARPGSGKATAAPVGKGGLDFALFDDDDDYYLNKKRRYQLKNGIEEEEPEEKRPRRRRTTAEKTTVQPVAKPEPPIEEAPVAYKPSSDEEIRINMPKAQEAKVDEYLPDVDFDDPFTAADPVQKPVKTSGSGASRGERRQKVDYGEQQSLDQEPEESEEPLDLDGDADTAPTAVVHEYVFPPIDLLSPPGDSEGGESYDDLLRNARTLEQSLASFGVEAKVLQVNKGPAVTRYELQPSEGVRVSRIMNLADDIALNLATSGIRIEGPIPGKKALGIEVPNRETTSVYLREVIDSDRFRSLSSPLAFALGKDIDGNVQVTDIARMPHLLIAGATGSGKSVCINCLLMSIIYKAKPDDVGLILIDPKVVELSVYNGVPHLLTPVVTDPKKAALSLNWAVQEMTKRYKRFSDAQVRDIKGFNEWVEANPDCGQPRMKRIIIVVDELADLMMVASKEVEDYICRLAQMARAAGIHLVIATQRPSVDVITGLIKANIPSRLAFAVSSGIDSRTILDMVGAEKLLGRGDMLFAPIGASKPLRIQGAFVSDHEVENVVAAVKQTSVLTDPDLEDTLRTGGSSTSSGGAEDDDLDEFLEQAIQYVVDKQKASISMLQRVFRIGFNRAARLMDALEERGIVGPDEGSKPRKVLMTSEELNAQDEEY